MRVCEEKSFRRYFRGQFHELLCFSCFTNWEVFGLNSCFAQQGHTFHKVALFRILTCQKLHPSSLLWRQSPHEKRTELCRQADEFPWLEPALLCFIFWRFLSELLSFALHCVVGGFGRDARCLSSPRVSVRRHEKTVRLVCGHVLEHWHFRHQRSCLQEVTKGRFFFTSTDLKLFCFTDWHWNPLLSLWYQSLSSHVHVSERSWHSLPSIV